jgi:hypothetical protein
MDKTYIPIGFQCTVPTVLKNMGLKGSTLPFDWMLSSPKFVYEILCLLLNDMSINELVTDHFFKPSSRTSCLNVEHYFTDPSGIALCNEKYDVIFPHDEYNNDNIEKYIRRFDRLYNLIKHGENLVYLYISPSSDVDGNFSIDGRHILSEENEYMIKIYDLIKENANSTFEFKVLSTYGERIEYDGIDFIYINPANCWIYLIDDCCNKLKVYETNIT